MGAVKQRYPLTKSQEMIWAGQNLSPDAPLYNMAFAFELKGEINTSIFRQAFQDLIQECEIMRMHLIIEQEQPMQVIQDEIDYQLPYLDFSSNETPEQKLKDWLAKQINKQFNLSEILFDAALIKVKADHYCWYLNQHHLITDGWSKTIQYQRMVELYQHLLHQKERPTPLPKYTDFVSFENQLHTSDQDQSTLDHWQQKINNGADLPSFYNKSNTSMESRCERFVVKISKEKADQLKALTQEADLRLWSKDLSLFTIFSGLLFVVTSKLSGQKNTTIGTPVHNRVKPDFQQTPGLFIELFPLGITLDKGETYLSLFNKVRDEYFDFLRYAKPGHSSPALSKLFNVVLNYINVSFADFDDIPLSADWIDSGHADPGHALRLQVHDFNDTGDITLIFDANIAVFSEAQSASLANQYLYLLDQFIKDRNQIIDPLLPTEKKQLDQFNQTKKDFEITGNITKLFEAQVLKTPDSIVLWFENQSLTYRQLDQRANQLAHYLIKQGVKEKDPVPICLDRSLHMIIGLMGIHKAGAAYVPIDPNYPAERIEYICSMVDAEVLITTSAYKTIFDQYESTKVIDLETDQEVISNQPLNPTSIDQTVDRPIYIIFTSGSTGRPKGVLNLHSGVVNQLLWGRDYFALEQNEIFLQKTTFCFDVSVFEIFLPLTTGGTLVMAKSGGQGDNQYLREVINQHQITYIHFVPSMLDLFMLDTTSADVPTLKIVFCSGEALKTRQVKQFKASFPAIPLHNLYGPTEAAVHVTATALTTEDLEQGVPIGYPVDNTQVQIINQVGQLCPVGVPGELCYSGVQIAQGYWKQPELTNERFVTNPFDQSSPYKMYRSGDLALWQPDGKVLFLGRNDSQVKIRGFRIELEEIEKNLLQINGILQTAVIAKANHQDKNQLIAYMVTDDSITVEQTRDQLALSLPEYMIPAYFVVLEEIPLLPNGKLNRRLLPTPFEIDSNTTQTYKVKPSNEFEEIIHEIWSALFPMQTVGIHDHFIQLGGDSLTGIRLVIKMNNAFELNLPVNIIFKKTTIAQLAEHVEKTIITLLENME